jgi:hypothetical protein
VLGGLAGGAQVKYVTVGGKYIKGVPLSGEGGIKAKAAGLGYQQVRCLGPRGVMLLSLATHASLPHPPPHAWRRARVLQCTGAGECIVMLGAVVTAR